jgi:hypothetical protein
MAAPRSHGPSALAAPLAILLLVAACSSGPATSTDQPAGSSGSTLASGAPADAGSVEAASSVLKAAKLADGESLGALEGIRFTSAGTQAAAALLGSGATGDALWAATYVYASSGADPAPLRALLTDPNASSTVRAMAAAGLVGAGDTSGFEPLIASLGGSDQMDGAEPAGAVWEFAGNVLERYTHTGLGPTLTATDAERATIQATWTTWLATNKARLHFDATTHLWVLA